MRDSFFEPGPAAGSRRSFLKAASLGGGLLLHSAYANAAQLRSAVAAAAAGLDDLETDDPDALRRIDPKLARAVDDAVARLKYTFAAAAAGERGGGDLAASCRNFVASRKAAVQHSYRTNAMAMLNAPAPLRDRDFGRYGAIAPAQFLSLSRPALMQRLGGPLLERSDLNLTPIQLGATNAIDLRKLLGEVEEAQAEAKTLHEKDDLEAGRKFEWLEVYVRRVECLEASEAWDEILLGGYAVGATGNKAFIEQFKVSDNFAPKSEGGKVNDSQNTISARDYRDIGGRHLAWLKLWQIKPWPHDHHLCLAMAEEDYGGFGSFLSDLWDKVGALILDVTLGSTFSIIPGLGTLIGIGIAKFIGWLIEGFKDDVVGAFTTSMTLTKMTNSYYHTQYPTSAHPKRHGSFASADGVTYKRDMKGNGQGHYRVKIGWRVFTQAGYAKRNVAIVTHPG